MSKIGRLSVAAVAAASMLVVGSSVGVAAATVPPPVVVFTVNSTADRADAVLNGVCQTAVVGECTLRAAIQEADVTAGPVTIDFAIPGSGVQTVAPGSLLPTLNNGTWGITIDGFSQPGSAQNTDPLIDKATRLIALQGQGPNKINGLVISGSNNVVRGLDIYRFGTDVLMTGTAALKNVIEGDLIGLQPDGSLDPSLGTTRINGASCIDLLTGPSKNHIGAPGPANRNVISGCYEKGVTLNNQHTSGNFIQNNLIGLDPTGTMRRGSLSHGVDMNWSVTGTLIGGGNDPQGFPERNVISGNWNDGIQISHGTATLHNSAIDNYIGTDPTGTSYSAATVNSSVGVYLEGKPICKASCPPDEGFETVTGNVIVNSGLANVQVDKGTHDSVIAYNLIGVTLNHTVVTNANGQPPGQYGVILAAGVTHITIGPGNEIAGRGIQITPLGIQPVTTVSSPTEYNTITQNSIHDVASPFGIDFLKYGQVNQNGAGDPNVNQGIDVPVLTSSSGILSAQTCAGCTVEVFASSAAPGAFGPGVTSLMTAVADSTGKAAFAAPTGPAVTATATTPLGSTSEFAQNIAA